MGISVSRRVRVREERMSGDMSFRKRGVRRGSMATGRSSVLTKRLSVRKHNVLHNSSMSLCPCVLVVV